MDINRVDKILETPLSIIYDHEVTTKTEHDSFHEGRMSVALDCVSVCWVYPY